MVYLAAAVIVVGIIGLLNLVLTFGVIGGSVNTPYGSPRSRPGTGTGPGSASCWRPGTPSSRSKPSPRTA